MTTIAIPLPRPAAPAAQPSAGPAGLTPLPGRPCPCCGQMVPVPTRATDDGAWQAELLTAFSAALGHHRGDGWRFLEALVTHAEAASSARLLAHELLGVGITTLNSRFHRHRLPSPKAYLAFVRLVRAAQLLEHRGRSVADVAYWLEHSSPQSFGRHVRAQMGMTVSEFRARYDGAAMLAHLVATLIQPHAATLRTVPLLTMRPPGPRPTRRPV